MIIGIGGRNGPRYSVNWNLPYLQTEMWKEYIWQLRIKKRRMLWDFSQI